MEGIKCCAIKDIKETLRTGKLVLFFALAFGIAVMIMFFSVFFENIPDSVTAELPGFDIESLEDLMSTLYPKMIKESLGVFSYYIGVFFSLIIIIITHSILPKENTDGKWILPIQQGYSIKDFIISKCAIYGTFAGFAVFCSYIFYYAAANTFMEHNLSFGNAFINALIHGLNIFFIICYTMLMSVLLPSPVLASISMIATVLFAPDLLKYFTIGEYMPTFMLSFVYDSRNDYGMLIGPLVLNIFLLAILYFATMVKIEKTQKTSNK